MMTSALVFSKGFSLVKMRQPCPITKIRELFPNKRVIVAFPPKRFNNELKQVAHGFIRVRRNALVQLPEQVTKSDGYILSRPNTWR